MAHKAELLLDFGASLGEISPMIYGHFAEHIGGVYYDGKELRTYPIYPAKVVDSNGAGDVFHGAFAAGLMKGFDPYKCCHFASAVSGLKCTGVGARESVPCFEQVKEYMEENGYEL